MSLTANTWLCTHRDINSSSVNNVVGGRAPIISFKRKHLISEMFNKAASQMTDCLALQSAGETIFSGDVIVFFSR